MEKYLFICLMSVCLQTFADNELTATNMVVTPDNQAAQHWQKTRPTHKTTPTKKLLQNTKDLHQNQYGSMNYVANNQDLNESALAEESTPKAPLKSTGNYWKDLALKHPATKLEKPINTPIIKPKPIVETQVKPIAVVNPSVIVPVHPVGIAIAPKTPVDIDQSPKTLVTPIVQTPKTISQPVVVRVTAAKVVNVTHQPNTSAIVTYATPKEADEILNQRTDYGLMRFTSINNLTADNNYFYLGIGVAYNFNDFKPITNNSMYITLPHYSLSVLFPNISAGYRFNRYVALEYSLSNINSDFNVGYNIATPLINTTSLPFKNIDFTYLTGLNNSLDMTYYFPFSNTNFSFYLKGGLTWTVASLQTGPLFNVLSSAHQLNPNAGLGLEYAKNNFYINSQFMYYGYTAFKNYNGYNLYSLQANGGFRF